MHRTTEQHLCELDYCARPAPHGTICPQCKSDTQEWLDRITRNNLQELHLIATRQAQPANRNRINSQNNDIQDALNLAVWSLWNDLANVWPKKIQNIHRDKHAPYIIDDIQNGVHAAIRLTEGEDEQAIDNAYIQKRMRQIFPMRPKDLIIYLKQHLGVQVSKQSINNWRNAGKLKPRLTNSEGWKFYHPADVLRAIDNDNRHDHRKYFYITETV